MTTIFIAYSGSSYALIGLFMAALAPFMVVKDCPNPDKLNDSAGAAGLWVGIRGTIIAMIIMSALEVCSVPGEQGRLACESLNRAIKSIQAAFEDLFNEVDPRPVLASCSGLLGDATSYSNGAILEPRFARCRWKSDFLNELVATATKLRLDVLTMRHAMEGADGDTGGSFMVLGKVPAFNTMKNDLMATLEDAREISLDLLQHTQGIWRGMAKLDTVEGIDELEGMDAAIDSLNKVISFPAKTMDSMEEDQAVQLSVVFVMLEYTVKHIGELIKATIKKQV